MVAHTGRTVRLGPGLKVGSTTQEAATATTYTLDWTQGGCCRSSVQSAAAFRRAPVDFPVSSSSTAALGDAFALIRGFNLPGSSNATIIDVASQVIAFSRASAGTVGDASQIAVVLGRSSPATVADDNDLGLPRSVPISATDTFRQVVTFARTSTATIGDSSQSASIFGRMALPSRWPPVP